MRRVRHRLVTTCTAVLLSALTGCRSPASGGVVAVVPSVLPGAPISMATRAGGLVFLAGRTAIDSVGRGIVAETHETLASLRRDAIAAGTGMDRLVRCTVFLLDLADRPAVERVVAGYLTGPAPTLVTVQVVATPIRGARVEVECVARAR